MNGYGIVVIVLVALALLGLAVAVVAGTIATQRHPDRRDPERNAARYVKPAMVGALLTLGAVVGLVLTGLVAFVDAIT